MPPVPFLPILIPPVPSPPVPLHQSQQLGSPDGTLLMDFHSLQLAGRNITHYTTLLRKLPVSPINFDEVINAIVLFLLERPLRVSPV